MVKVKVEFENRDSAEIPDPYVCEISHALHLTPGEKKFWYIVSSVGLVSGLSDELFDTHAAEAGVGLHTAIFLEDLADRLDIPLLYLHSYSTRDIKSGFPPQGEGEGELYEGDLFAAREIISGFLSNGTEIKKLIRKLNVARNEDGPVVGKIDLLLGEKSGTHPSY
jgi:hypothetical protein